MIFNPCWYDNSRSDGVAVLEIIDKGERAPNFVPLIRTTLEGQVAGPLVDFTLTHTFRYTKETNPHAIEALYRFPLPGDTAVTSVEVSFGKVTIHSLIKVRKEAEIDYKNAKKENKAAALVTRESPDVFTLRIAGIAPDDDVIIKTRYVQIGQPNGTGFSFRVPLTTAPRYVRRDEQYSRHANGQPLAILKDPGHRFGLSVALGGNGRIKSPTHAITVTAGGIVTLDQGEVIPDRDCVLNWDPLLGDTTPACQVFSDGKDETHFLALVSPPQQPPVQYPRDVIILVDHSGSMEGPKWESADWAVERFISGLSGQDTFNLCLFESRTYWFSEQTLAAQEANKTQAIRFLKDKRSGGTELGVALEQAISQQRRKGTLSRNIIIITDAEVTDAARILRIVDKESQHKEARRCSILCIDAAPNTNLAQQLAERGGGIAKFLSSSPKEEDITSALDKILALWDTPVAVGLTLRVNRDNLLVDRRKVKKSPDGMCHVDLGDLPSCKSTWIVVRAPPGNEPLSFELCGPDDCTFPVSVIPSQAVSVLFGVRLIAELEYLMHAGYPEKELSRHLTGLGYDLKSLNRKQTDKVYDENRMLDSMNLIKDVVVRESLKYQVLSAETAFIAVRSEPGRKIEEQVYIPNALPFGWSDSFVTGLPYPRMEKRSNIRLVNVPKAGGYIDWVCGGERMDMIMQPDGTMKLDPRVSSSRKSCNAISQNNIPLQRWAVPAVSDTQDRYRLFEGIPVFCNGEAVLFDSSRAEQANKVPNAVVLKKLESFLKDRNFQTVTGLYILVYVEDPAIPRIKVFLKDLLQHQGSRPLNIQRTRGELLKIVLVDPDGTWAKNAPALELVVRE